MNSLNIVQTTAKVLYILSAVSFVFTAVGIMGCFVSGILFFFAPFLGENLMLLIFSEIPADAWRLSLSLLAKAILLLGFAAATAVFWQYLKKEQSDGTPFTHDGALMLRRTGVLAVAFSLGAEIIASVFLAIFSVESLLGGDNSLFPGLMMIFLSFLFEYGAELRDGTHNAPPSAE